ncbi:MAG: hypothetical protein UT04_C0015G0008 [Candidatus Daviesbacteria bacterium GW2011_GWF2_38_7]|nr:MAG: hypothetical protein UT04_C0015G0008 [Candidatus Daviesbacteria bacterium GW2011_GWF2_38_7]
MDGKSAEGTHTTSLPISEVIKVCDNRISSTGRCFSDTLSRDLRYQCASIAGTRRCKPIILDFDNKLLRLRENRQPANPQISPSLSV